MIDSFATRHGPLSVSVLLLNVQWIWSIASAAVPFADRWHLTGRRFAGSNVEQRPPVVLLFPITTYWRRTWKLSTNKTATNVHNSHPFLFLYVTLIVSHDTPINTLTLLRYPPTVRTRTPTVRCNIFNNFLSFFGLGRTDFPCLGCRYISRYAHHREKDEY